MTNDDDFKKALERFKLILQTRNFEIEMFWKRCNYFLVLNTALAVGVFALFGGDNGKVSPFVLPLLFLVGACVCFAWIKVGLGSKYWQSHWEQVAIEEQKTIGFCESRDRDYFSIGGTKARVNENLFSHDKKIGLWDTYYNRCVLRKPSVSRWMHRTAVFFFGVWAVMLVSWVLWKCGFWAWLFRALCKMCN